MPSISYFREPQACLRLVESISPSSRAWEAMVERFTKSPRPSRFLSIWNFVGIVLLNVYLSMAGRLRSPSFGEALWKVTIGTLISLVIFWILSWCLARIRSFLSRGNQDSESTQAAAIAAAEAEAAAEHERIARRSVDLCYPFGNTELQWDAHRIQVQTEDAIRSWTWNELCEIHHIDADLVLYFDESQHPFLLVMQPDEEFLRRCRAACSWEYESAA